MEKALIRIMWVLYVCLLFVPFVVVALAGAMWFGVKAAVNSIRYDLLYFRQKIREGR